MIACPKCGGLVLEKVGIQKLHGPFLYRCQACHHECNPNQAAIAGEIMMKPVRELTIKQLVMAAMVAVTDQHIKEILEEAQRRDASFSVVLEEAGIYDGVYRRDTDEHKQD